MGKVNTAKPHRRYCFYCSEVSVLDSTLWSDTRKCALLPVNRNIYHKWYWDRKSLSSDLFDEIVHMGRIYCYNGIGNHLEPTTDCFRSRVIICQLWTIRKKFIAVHITKGKLLETKPLKGYKLQVMFWLLILRCSQNAFLRTQHMSDAMQLHQLGLLLLNRHARRLISVWCIHGAGRWAAGTSASGMCRTWEADTRSKEKRLLFLSQMQHWGTLALKSTPGNAIIWLPRTPS